MEIENNREQIDVLDKKILDLLNQRARHVVAIGQYKRANNMPVFDAKREQNLLSKIKDLNPGPFSSEAVEDIFKAIIKESRELEDNLRSNCSSC
ncbi:MAG: chorismate mutase [Fibrobacteria bacterium]|nr:chorismate mutase [Fibrobacteria bacterium]